MNLKKYNKLKTKVERLQRSIDQLKGARQHGVSQLQSEFDCETLKQAKRLLSDLKTEKGEVDEQIETTTQEFTEKWGETLDLE